MEGFLKNTIEEVNQYLYKYMKNLPDYIPEVLRESMEYSLFAGGKRIRPIILLEISKTFTDNIKDSIPLACALEMIHTYSLVHDDLPAMDDDDYRRGKKTNHKVYGEAMAILAGDGLLNYAFEIMINHSLNLHGKEQSNYLEAIREITSSSGVGGMITGQVADMKNTGDFCDEKTLNFINKYKTGQLFKASVLAGAKVQGASEEQIAELTSYSNKIGIAFQIVDDLLDVIGDEKTIGKQIKNDQKNNKKTYVEIYGIEESKAAIEKLIKEALKHLDKSACNSDEMVYLSNFICRRDY